MTIRNVLFLTLLAVAPGAAQTPAAAPPPSLADPPSSSWLSLLPEGEAKRRFVLDCTGCHQFDAKIARPAGTPRSEAQWVEAITRMLGYAGATTSFPVIAAARDAKATAAWLARHLPAGEMRQAPGAPAAGAEITEYLMPVPQDLPHDVAVEPGGTVLVTGMFTHRLFRVRPSTGAVG